MSCVSSTDGIPAGFQDLQNVCDHGNTTTTGIAIAGAAIADGFAGAQDLVVGDGSATCGATFHTSRYAYIGAVSAPAGNDTGLLIDTLGTPLVGIRLVGTTYYQARAAAFRPQIDGGPDLGEAARRWKDFYMAGDATINGDVTLDSASPNLTSGDGTANPRIVMNKLGGGTGFMVVQLAGTLTWAIGSGGGDHFQINRYPGGVYADQTEYDLNTGEWRYPADGNYNSAAPTVTIGSGGGAPILIMDQNADEAAEFQVANASGNIGALLFGTGAPASAPGNTRFYFRFDGAAGTSIYKRTGGAWVAIA